MLNSPFDALAAQSRSGRSYTTICTSCFSPVLFWRADASERYVPRSGTFATESNQVKVGTLATLAAFALRDESEMLAAAAAISAA